MPKPEGSQDDRFVYVVTAEGVEALRQSAAAFDSEREPPTAAGRAAGRAAAASGPAGGPCSGRGGRRPAIDAY
jgi:hypothetical protein